MKPTIRYLFEGSYKRDSDRYDVIASFDTEDEAIKEQQFYLSWTAEKPEESGWLNFRVVKTTTTREIVAFATA